MCGRYSVFSSTEVLEDRFNAEALEQWAPHYNAAPSQRLPIIGNNRPRKIQLGQWGFRPAWMKKPGGIINARAESIHEKPFFRSALDKRRCLVLADSFFEWRRAGGFKVPWCIRLKSEEPFAFAGIWEPASSPAEAPTFAIITTRPNGKVAAIHDRMPVMLSRGAEELWLHPEGGVDFLRSLMQPYPAGEMELFAVSQRVNSVAADDPDVLSPVAGSIPQ